MRYPKWALKYKEKGTTLRKINDDKYYLYKVHSKRVKDKPYPVLVQEGLIGIIDKNGITYTRRKLIDLDSIEIRCILDFKDLIFLEEYLNNELDILKDIYLLKVNNRWYLAKLDKHQEEVLNKHNVRVSKDGIIAV